MNKDLKEAVKSFAEKVTRHHHKEVDIEVTRAKRDDYLHGRAIIKTRVGIYTDEMKQHVQSVRYVDDGVRLDIVADEKTFMRRYGGGS